MSISSLVQLRLEIILWNWAVHFMPCRNNLELSLIETMIKDALDHPKSALETANEPLTCDSWRCDCYGCSKIKFNLPPLCIELLDQLLVIIRSYLFELVHMAAVSQIVLARKRSNMAVSKKLWQSRCHKKVKLINDILAWLAKDPCFVRYALTIAGVNRLGWHRIDMAIRDVRWRLPCVVKIFLFFNHLLLPRLARVLFFDPSLLFL